MKLFLDTANIHDITRWLSTGIVDGITTNPTLLSKEGKNPKDVVLAISHLLEDREVSIEVTESDPDAVYLQAKKIAALSSNIVVKIPCSISYYPIIQQLVHEKIPLNITLVFSLFQGMAMCKLGVKYISPFIGRLDDIDEDGIQLIHDLRSMIDQYGYGTQILAASVRTMFHLHAIILAGADVATVPIAVLEQAVRHTLTEEGMKKFLEDWKKLEVTSFP